MASRPLLGVAESKPSEYGAGQALASELEHGVTTGSAGAHIEEPTPNLRALAADGRCIEMKGITKVFSSQAGRKVAVDGMDLTIYSDQITCLLGHNGAGASWLWVCARTKIETRR